jgi:RNA polymerase-binding transcription factor DksA
MALRGRLMQDSGQKLKEAAEPIEAHSMHAADSATDEFEHDVALTLLAREETALREVNDAITRILEGKYGVCEFSGVAIPASRLRALPWCRYSVEAERQIERAGGNGRCRVPGAVSLRGGKSDLPGTGTITREDSEGPAEEPSERDEAKKVADESTPTIGEIEPTDAAKLDRVGRDQTN